MRQFCFLLTIALLPCVSQAALNVASPFTDHAVLQQGLAVPVWGKADPGAGVTVEFAGQKKTGQSDRSGKWKVALDALDGTAKASNMTISSGASKITLVDVVVGEVWICSGQSNMQMGRTPDLKGLSEAGLRTFEVKRTVAFTEQEDVVGTWKTGGPNSAVAFGFAHHLAKKTDGVPVGIILSAWGSSSIEAWLPRDLTKQLPHFKTIMAEWDANTEAQAQIKAALAKKKWSRNEDVFMRRQSCIVYNAMMKPLAPFACRGFVWYQGERNSRYLTGMPKEPWFHRVASVQDYDETLKAMVNRYRKEWGRDDLQFMGVMLPGFGSILSTSPTRDLNNPTAHSWAWMRESQLAILDLPHTAVANTIDLGDVKNIHSKDKGPIGERLALLAAGDTLGKNLAASGPVIRHTAKHGHELKVSFNHSAGLKTSDGQAPTEFWIAGRDGKWFPTVAKIEQDFVVLSSPDCPNPVFVRYAFTGKPSVNLVNGAGLPAYPFRTDRFEP
ncbi:MAG: sialate O-acetylesterase [Limisphaerales bacterium]